jgi:hypothetical protein
MAFEKDKEVARRKGLAAGAATAGAVALGLMVSPVLGIIAAIPSAYLVKNWFMYRAKRGMRF